MLFPFQRIVGQRAQNWFFAVFSGIHRERLGPYSTSDPVASTRDAEGINETSPLSIAVHGFFEFFRIIFRGEEWQRLSRVS
jgi:hypothetical protein